MPYEEGTFSGSVGVAAIRHGSTAPAILESDDSWIPGRWRWRGSLPARLSGGIATEVESFSCAPPRASPSTDALRPGVGEFRILT
jgi:hypothetical protein